MCYRCGKHEHFIAECPESMEAKPEQKHHPRTDHKHRSRDDYKGKNKSEQRPRKSGGNKKKERAMVVGASDIDSSSCYSSSIPSDEEENCETWVPLGHQRPGSRLSPTSGSGLPEDSLTRQ
jgi:hypothetical protein